jgi:hypothetical protein
MKASVLVEDTSFLWCYSCERSTAHEVRYRSDPEFIGSLLVCRDCGESVKEPLREPGVPTARASWANLLQHSPLLSLSGLSTAELALGSDGR